MHRLLAEKFNRGVNLCANEEELRILWISELQACLEIQFQTERERNDAYHNGVIIEFKSPGLFSGRTNSPAFKEAVFDRLDKYMRRRAETEGLELENYIQLIPLTHKPPYVKSRVL